jgi:hypothetical protein
MEKKNKKKQVGLWPTRIVLERSGFEQAFRPFSDLPGQIYRFRPSTGQVWLVSDQFTQCNGIYFSPDYRTMYVTDTGAIQAHDGPGDEHQLSLRPRLPATIYAFDVVNGQTLPNRRALPTVTRMSRMELSVMQRGMCSPDAAMVCRFGTSKAL